MDTVAYGIERMNRDVSQWMRGLSGVDGTPEIPFMATRGYDSIVWNRLYSRDVSDLNEYQISQVNNPLLHAFIASFSYQLGEYKYNWFSNIPISREFINMCVSFLIWLCSIPRLK